MDRNERIFLSLLGNAAAGTKADLPEDAASADWAGIFRLASRRHVLPMIVDAAHQSGVSGAVPAPYAAQAARLMTVQTQQTANFLALYRFLHNRGLAVMVVGGLICRALYPQPDQRISQAEHLLIPPDHIGRVHEALLEYGLETDTPEAELSLRHTISYRARDSRLYLDVHRYLFPPEADADGGYNRFFRNVWTDCLTQTAEGVPVITMQYTDHLFFLICRAMLHFPGEFGLRQVCDICLYAGAYGEQIDWERVLRQCTAVNAVSFAAALFRIGRVHLGLADIPSLPDALLAQEQDEAAMLKELLGADRERSEGNSYNTYEYLSVLRARIEAGDIVNLRISGSSMTPFLCHRRDCVTLQAPDAAPQKGDIVFYQRDDGAFVLHRICSVHGSGGTAVYDIVGDGQMEIETGVRRDQIFAVVIRAVRKGRTIAPGDFWWWFFRTIWLALLPMRPFLNRVYSVMHRNTV